MIFDHCNNWKYYSAIAPEIFRTAFDFVQTITAATENRRYELGGNGFYALVQSYLPKPLTEGKIEAHRQYIDLQIMVGGSEIIGVSPLAGLKEIAAYAPEKDVDLFEYSPTSASLVKLHPGEFLLLFAGEGHMPCIALDERTAAEVKKVVVKIHRDLLTL